MPRVCRVCTDPRREEIDQMLVGGQSVPSIGRETGLPESNLYRHKKEHMNLARSIVESSPAAAISSIEALQARDAELASIQAIALTRGHTGAFVQAANQRIRIILEMANLRGEITPKPKTVMHVNLDRETAERIAMNYLRYQELSGGVIDAKNKAK
jgi:hypothetical protein